MSRDTLKWLMLLALACAAVPGGARAAEMRAMPEHLRDTGLYAHGLKLHPDALPFSPQYPLWSDGASKRRWIYLPTGTSVDATRPDAWNFPRGTKLWKEFSHGRALETRYIERGADGEWRYASYIWNAEGTDAVLAPAAGVRDMPAPGAPGGRYSIPAENDCRACHEGAPVPVLGFSALQLSPDRDPLALHADAASVPGTDLRSLVARGVLRNLPADLLVRAPRIEAANPAERAALGYLHGNCGHCHNDDGPLAALDMTLAQRVGSQSASGAVLRSIVGVRSQARAAELPTDAARIAPGEFGASAIAVRMRSRNPLQQMPPLGTEVADAQAMALIARWIEGLPVH
jgi:hypothetical protein